MVRKPKNDAIAIIDGRFAMLIKGWCPASP